MATLRSRWHVVFTPAVACACIVLRRARLAGMRLGERAFRSYYACCSASVILRRVVRGCEP